MFLFLIPFFKRGVLVLLFLSSMCHGCYLPQPPISAVSFQRSALVTTGLNDALKVMKELDRQLAYWQTYLKKYPTNQRARKSYKILFSYWQRYAQYIGALTSIAPSIVNKNTSLENIGVHLTECFLKDLALPFTLPALKELCTTDFKNSNLSTQAHLKEKNKKTVRTITKYSQPCFLLRSWKKCLATGIGLATVGTLAYYHKESLRNLLKKTQAIITNPFKDLWDMRHEKSPECPEIKMVDITMEEMREEYRGDALALQQNKRLETYLDFSTIIGQEYLTKKAAIIHDIQQPGTEFYENSSLYEQRLQLLIKDTIKKIAEECIQLRALGPHLKKLARSIGTTLKKILFSRDEVISMNVLELKLLFLFVSEIFDNLLQVINYYHRVISSGYKVLKPLVSINLAFLSVLTLTKLATYKRSAYSSDLHILLLRIEELLITQLDTAGPVSLVDQGFMYYLTECFKEAMPSKLKSTCGISLGADLELLTNPLASAAQKHALIGKMYRHYAFLKI